METWQLAAAGQWEVCLAVERDFPGVVFSCFPLSKCHQRILKEKKGGCEEFVFLK